MTDQFGRESELFLMQRDLTFEAMADVDDGRDVDHEAVVAWAASPHDESPLPFPKFAFAGKTGRGADDEF